MLNAKIKKMLLSENGASIPAIQRKLNIGFVEAKARIQKLSKRYNIVYDSHTYKIKGKKDNPKRLSLFLLS